jgi:hypothetical protein
MSASPQALLKKLQALPPQRRAEVEDFIDFLSGRDDDRSLVRAAQAVSEKALQEVWDNPADAAYDEL